MDSITGVYPGRSSGISGFWTSERFYVALPPATSCASAPDTRVDRHPLGAGLGYRYTSRLQVAIVWVGVFHGGVGTTLVALLVSCPDSWGSSSLVLPTGLLFFAGAAALAGALLLALAPATQSRRDQADAPPPDDDGVASSPVTSSIKAASR